MNRCGTCCLQQNISFRPWSQFASPYDAAVNTLPSTSPGCVIAPVIFFWQFRLLTPRGFDAVVPGTRDPTRSAVPSQASTCRLLICGYLWVNKCIAHPWFQAEQIHVVTITNDNHAHVRDPRSQVFCSMTFAHRMEGSYLYLSGKAYPFLRHDAGAEDRDHTYLFRRREAQADPSYPFRRKEVVDPFSRAHQTEDQAGRDLFHRKEGLVDQGDRVLCRRKMDLVVRDGLGRHKVKVQAALADHRKAVVVEGLCLVHRTEGLVDLEGVVV